MDFYNCRFALWFAQPGAREWAITIGTVTFYSTPENRVTDRWRRHEECHKKQWRRYWYVGFLVLYLLELHRKGYWNNKYEVEARSYELP